jgi:hypothetical protein
MKFNSNATVTNELLNHVRAMMRNCDVTVTRGVLQEEVTEGEAQVKRIKRAKEQLRQVGAKATRQVRLPFLLSAGLSIPHQVIGLCCWMTIISSLSPLPDFFRPCISAPDTSWGSAAVGKRKAVL